jgi:RNA polymerase sigma-70 factor, ECF subfamily
MVRFGCYPSMADDVVSTLEGTFRREWPLLVAAAARIVGDLSQAEEIAQDVMVTALDRWPFSGVPDRPGAWLLTATRNRARNVLRDRARAVARERATALPEVAAPEVDGDEALIADDRLRLVFVCCHPVLGQDAQVALTLRLLGGLSTREIARAFLVPETTLAQRLVRAKRTLANARVPFAVPDPQFWPERLPAVLSVIYLIFNEGYEAAEGPTLSRPVLCEEARRLAALLVEMVPDQPEVHGLAGLLALSAARLAARVDDAGGLVALEYQDRSRWDTRAIDEGRAAIERALRCGEPGPITLQAMIAACHAEAPTWDSTNWAAIVALYDRLYTLSPGPVVALNRAVAMSMTSLTAEALAVVDRLTAGDLARYHLAWATRADFLRRLGRFRESAADYRRAAALAGNEAERHFLTGRAELCEGGSDPGVG